MPDASKNGNPSDASNSKSGSVAGMSSETERQQQAAAAYDDGSQRAAIHTADFSRHSETVSSGYSAGTDAIGVSNPVSGPAQDAQGAAETFGSSFGAYDTGRTGFDQPASVSGQGFSQPQTQQTAPAIAAQPIQQVPAAFSSRMEQQDSGSPFMGGADRNAAAQRNMMTSIDGIGQAGIAGSRDFI